MEVLSRLVDGTSRQTNLHHTHIVNGKNAWYIDGDGASVAVPPEDAKRYQLDLWLNPISPTGSANSRRRRLQHARGLERGRTRW